MGASGALLTIYCTVTEIAVECWIAPKVAVTVTVIVLRRLNFGDAVAASARRRAESWRPASRGSAPRVSGASCRSPSPERRPSIPAAATRRRVLLPARRQGQETPWQRACTISESCRSSCLKKPCRRQNSPTRFLYAVDFFWLSGAPSSLEAWSQPGSSARISRS